MHGDLALLASNQYQKAKARYPECVGPDFYGGH